MSRVCEFVCLNVRDHCSMFLNKKNLLFVQIKFCIIGDANYMHTYTTCVYLHANLIHISKQMVYGISLTSIISKTVHRTNLKRALMSKLIRTDTIFNL